MSCRIILDESDWLAEYEWSGRVRVVMTDSERVTFDRVIFNRMNFGRVAFDRVSFAERDLTDSERTSTEYTFGRVSFSRVNFGRLRVNFGRVNLAESEWPSELRRIRMGFPLLAAVRNFAY